MNLIQKIKNLIKPKNVIHPPKIHKKEQKTNINEINKKKKKQNLK